MSNVALSKQQSSYPAFTMGEAELIEVLRNSLYPGAQDNSIKMVISYCRASNLDPMQKPVHIVPIYDSKLKAMRDVVMPGIGLYRSQASRSGEYAGVSEPEFGDDVDEAFPDETFYDKYEKQNKSRSGFSLTYPKWCRVTVRRLLSNGSIVEFTAKELWKENYATASRDSKHPNSMWTRRPYAQLAKCAEAQALRKAFPEFGAQPTADEMEGKEIDITQETTVITPPPPEREEITDDQFNERKAKWKGAVAKGKSTADLIAWIEAKATLTDKQREEINSWANATVIDDFVAAMNEAEREAE